MARCWGLLDLVAPYGTPILGIHLGHFGFITEVAPDALFSAVETALAGECTVEERLMLRGVITRASPAPEGTPDGEENLVAMNDIVAASGAVRMVHVRTYIGDDLLATYAADGVIVASPTGFHGLLALRRRAADSPRRPGPRRHPGLPAYAERPRPDCPGHRDRSPDY